MAQLKITPAQATTFRALRGLTTPDAKATRKGIWNAIRAQFSIPSTLKLKVEEDPAVDSYLVLKDKVTGRELIGVSSATSTGLRYTQVAPPPAAPQPAVQGTTIGAAAQSTARFSVATDSNASTAPVVGVSVAQLLELLRDADIGIPSALPDGAPTLTGDAVLLDNADAILYFRA